MNFVSQKNCKTEDCKYKAKYPFLYIIGEKLDKEFRIDLLIENKVIVELKAVDELKDIHEVQLVTYLKLTNMKLGLLIKFNVPILYKGIRRKVNGL